MKKLIVLIVIVLMACPSLSVAGEGANTGGDANRATTVKSGKSNSSDRVGAGANEATTVKSSKSNQSDRVGGTDGQAPDQANKVKSSKSNSSE